MISIRGAITVEENSVDSILKNTTELINTIKQNNNLHKDDVISIIFSSTNDLNKVAPAKAARNLGYLNASLMNFNEMEVENGLSKCIRVMFLCNIHKPQNQVKHVYLKGATILRPDLV